VSNEIIKVDNSLVFDWSDVTSATKYHCRVSRDYDFATVDHENNNLATSTYSVTLTTGAAKYYWQWRSYVGAWNKWQEVQSFERVSSGADLTITNGKWMMFAASERASTTLTFTTVPRYRYTEGKKEYAERNINEDLLSEFYATKASIELELDSISAEEKNEILRYYGMTADDIYLACAPISNNGVDYYRNIWKIYFTSKPEVKPLGGNEARYVMKLNLEEK